MYENMKKLKEEFIKIREKGWINGVSNGFGNGGRTFEYLLGKKEADDLPVADYNGIEIKTRAYNSQYKMSLFSTVPDGPELFEIKRIVDTYGFPARELKSANVLFGNVNAKEKSFIGRHFQFQLEVNYSDKRIYLLVFNKYGKLIERRSFWSFELLRERIEIKINAMAIVKLRGRYINNEKYFSYHDIIFYRLKSFDTFLQLIEEGIITLSIKIDIYRDERRFGNIHDHGTGFQIDEDDLQLLFDRVDI